MGHVREIAISVLWRMKMTERERLEEALKKTDSPYLKRDYKKKLRELKRMNRSCFAWVFYEKEMGDFKVRKEKCFCLDSADCDGCSFYKNKDTVIRREYYIHQTKIVEWLPK